jgi:hypothetical protein
MRSSQIKIQSSSSFPKQRNRSITMAIFRSLVIQAILFGYVFAANITVIPLNWTPPKPYVTLAKPATSDFDVLSRNIAFPAEKDRLVYETETFYVWLDRNASYVERNESFAIYPSQDSFIRGSIHAAAKEQHLEIRPDEVWLTVLSQLNFYLRRHGNDKAVIDIYDNLGGNGSMVFFFLQTINGWPWQGEFIQRNKTNWMFDWVRANFTTSDPGFWEGSEPGDGVDSLATLLMMATPNSLSADIAPLPCTNGLPSITLLGVKKDWEDLKQKLERLKEFGNEPAHYANRLMPIFSRFIKSFQEPNSNEIRRFWSDVFIIPCHSGAQEQKISGWINGFHYWDTSGSPLPSGPDLSGDKDLKIVTLDGVKYPVRYTSKLPSAYYSFQACFGADAPGNWQVMMYGGLMGYMVRSGVPEGYSAALRALNLTLPSTAVARGGYSSLRAVLASTVVEKLPRKVKYLQFHWISTSS